MKDLHKLTKLIRQIKNGDRGAFGELYDLFVDRVYRFIYFRVDKREDAEDLTEQIFVKALEKLPDYEEKGLPFEAWLFRVARNAVIDFYRTRKIHVPLQKAAEVESSAPTPEEIAEHSLTKEWIMEKLRRLPDNYREVLVMTYLEELSHEEISLILGKPVAHVRVLQSRALAALRQKINGQ